MAECRIVCIGGLGELVRLVIPRNREIDFVSSSFSLRAVRASEAKLCGRMQTVILIAGPPGS